MGGRISSLLTWLPANRRHHLLPGATHCHVTFATVQAHKCWPAALAVVLLAAGLQVAAAAGAPRPNKEVAIAPEGVVQNEVDDIDPKNGEHWHIPA